MTATQVPFRLPFGSFVDRRMIAKGFQVFQLVVF
jgi:hypothetical protein